MKTIGHIQTDIGNASLANRPEPLAVGGVSPIDLMRVEPRYRFTDDATPVMDNRASGVSGDRPPVVTNPIADRDVEWETSFDVNLSGVFGDPDGDPITYVAVSSDTTVSDTSLVGAAVLRVTAKDKRGASTITVTVTANGKTAVNQFVATTTLPETISVDDPYSPVNPNNPLVGMSGNYELVNGEYVQTTSTVASHTVYTGKVRVDGSDVWEYIDTATYNAFGPIATYGGSTIAGGQDIVGTMSDGVVITAV